MSESQESRRTYYDTVITETSAVTHNSAPIWSKLRRICRSKITAFLGIMSLGLPVTWANPIGNVNSDNAPARDFFFPYAVFGYSIFAVLFTLIAHYLAMRSGPMRVWGFVSVGSAYTSLMIRNDLSTTLSLSMP